MIYIPKEGMPAKDVKILEEVQGYESSYFTFDKPIPFCGLMIYPVTVRDYDLFLFCSSCFTLNKNDDPEGIRKSHLDYLLDKMQGKEEGIIWSFRFSKLIELMFHLKNGLKCDKCGKFKTYEEFSLEMKEKGEATEHMLECECGGHLHEMVGYATDEKTKKKYLNIDGHVVTSKDFDKLRRIALYQNLPDYKDDSWVHPEIRKDQEAKAELKKKVDGEVRASLERKIICVSSKTNYKIAEIFDLSIRKFLILLDVVDSAITYQAELQGRYSGLVSSKAPIDHWVYKREKGLYDSATSSDEYTGTINRANGG